MEIQIDPKFIHDKFKQDRELDIELKQSMLEQKRFDLQKSKEEHALNKITNLRWLLESRRIDEEATKPLSENPSWKNSLDMVDEGLVVQKIMTIIKSI